MMRVFGCWVCSVRKGSLCIVVGLGFVYYSTLLCQY